MKEDKVQQIVRQAELERALKAEGIEMAAERVARYLELDSINVVPNRSLAAVTEECKRLYRDGNFSAAVALCQALAEVVVRDLYQKSLKKKPSRFEDNVKRLLSKKRISPECEQALREVWQGRDDYPYLNPGVLEDRAKLKKMARDKLTALWRVETEVLGLG